MADEKKNPLGPVGEQVRVNLERLRTGRGLSKKDVSDRAASLGRPIPPLGVSRIEAGSRRVDADDLVALGLVLNVSPAALLLPPEWSDEMVALAPDWEVRAKVAWQWVEGRAPASKYGEDDVAVVDDDDDAEAAYWRQREEYEALTHPPQRRRTARHPANRAAQALSKAVDQVAAAEAAGDADRATAALERARASIKQLQAALELAELALKER
ncbi:helix-turn-helix domain-containing protein [Kitasatospora cineracea]